MLQGIRLLAVTMADETPNNIDEETRPIMPESDHPGQISTPAPKDGLSLPDNPFSPLTKEHTSMEPTQAISGTAVPTLPPIALRLSEVLSPR